MSLFRGMVPPRAILSDEAFQRYLAAIRAEIRPDPLFRRRLRGEVMNRYVAAREGIGVTPARRSMGALGRAVLYATFAMAVTSTSVLAASQEALPGDLLYPLKRHVEALRVQVLPAHLHDDLAAYALAERINELGHLAERGAWGRVAIQAVAVEHHYDAFLLLAEAAPPGENDRYLTVLAGLVDRLPVEVRAVVEAVIDRRPGDDPLPVRGGPKGEARRGNGGSSTSVAGAAGEGGDSTGRLTREVLGDSAPEPKLTTSPGSESSSVESRGPEASSNEADEDADKAEDGQ